MNEKKPICSFCDEPINSQNIIQGSKSSDTFICHRCINQSKSLLDNRISEQLNQIEYQRIAENLLYPDEIFKLLNEYIIGQEEAKKTLSVAVYLHFKRLSYILDKKDKNKNSNSNTENDAVELDKSNILLLGPSGSGKTLLATTLARILKVPFAIADATTLTEAGYVGDDVENILLRLIQNADFKIPWAEKGIVFIDEIDKIGRKSENSSLTRDVSGEGVQQALLKIIEGTVASVPAQGGRKHPQSQNIMINTKNILFICGGAFVGIEKLVKSRRNDTTIGFKKLTDEQSQSPKSDKEVNAEQNEVVPEDLVHFGLIPELVGRLPVICSLQELSKDDLKRILSEPKNSLLKQYKKLCQLENKELVIEDSAINDIIEKSKKYDTGARALRSILEKIMLDILFEAPRRKEKKIILSHGTIQNRKFFKK